MASEHQPEQQDAFAQFLFDAVREKLDGITSHAAILPVFQQVLEFLQTLVTQLEDGGESPLVACRSGCSFCCHSQVSIIPIEALLMAGFVVAEFTGSQVRSLQDRIVRARSLTAGKSPSQVYAMKKDLPCIFLDGGRCGVYTARPSICRSWNSFDAAACRLAYDSPDMASSVSSSPARNFVFGTARELFQTLTRDLSLQHDTLLLPNAMSDCFLLPDPLVHWAKGEIVFHYG